MIKHLSFIFLRKTLLIELGCLKERKSAHHIGTGKGEWILDGAVHMALGSQMDDAVHLLLLHQFIKGFKDADVHLYKLVVGLILNVFKIGEVSCVCEFV